MRNLFIFKHKKGIDAFISYYRLNHLSIKWCWMWASAPPTGKQYGFELLLFSALFNCSHSSKICCLSPRINGSPLQHQLQKLISILCADRSRHVSSCRPMLSYKNLLRGFINMWTPRKLRMSKSWPFLSATVVPCVWGRFSSLAAVVLCGGFMCVVLGCCFGIWNDPVGGGGGAALAS